MNPTIKEVSAITLLSARNWNAQPREAMISITGTGEARVVLKKGWRHVLRVTFDDIEKTQFGLKLFSDREADKVIDFLDKIEGKVDHVVIHCRFGQSRSPAIARYISQRYDLSNGFGNHRTFNRHVFSTLFWRWRHRVAPGEGGFCDMGFLPEDHWLYSTGPIVSGRPIVPPPKEQRGGPGTHTRGGFLPEDHWLYSSGPIVSGRPIVPPPKDPPSGAERVIDHGLLPPDDPIYSVGPIVNGREIGKPYRKMTPEEIERNFQVARDAIAKGNKKPSENN